MASGGAGTGGATGGEAGTAGAGGSAGAAGGGNPSTACTVDDDCVVAEVYSPTGCCSRRCGTALNGEFVASDPCSTVDAATDPVPEECSTGCTLCPAADPRCPHEFGALCVSGTCMLVTSNGPCETEDDCVLAVDYETTLGACCNCAISASKATLASADCIVAQGEPKPSGCDLEPVDACASVSCPAACAEPSTGCSANRCGP
jgi:hypothetical protein